jgi:hypothetical protein
MLLGKIRKAELGCENVVEFCEAAVRRLYSETLAAADLVGRGGKVNLQNVGPTANSCHAR